MYAIIDSIVDQYFYVIEQISENIEGLEEELML
jgi:Mg2+ and Co2+ transporter CorA